MKITANNISHSFDSLKVLKELSLHMESDMTHILIGPSGCGKTTLLQIMAGLITPDEGEIILEHQPASNSLQEAAFVFQTPTLVPWLTVEQNISLILKPHQLSDQENTQRIRQSLTEVQLTGFGQAYPKQLSGGMQQRAALARAIAVSPALLLLDEPFANLDAMSRKLLGENMILSRKTPSTCIMVTHSLEEACLLGDYIHILSCRPGHLTQSIENPVYRNDRLSPASATELTYIKEMLWQSLRADALHALLAEGEKK